MNQGDRIHAAIRGAIAAFAFPTVTFPNGVRTTSAVETVSASSAIIRPEGSGFVSSQSRRKRERTRDNWNWNCEVGFSCLVSLEEFEDSFNTPLQLPRDPGNGLPDQVTILLEEATYSHPPRSEPASGSRATFRFVAEISPR